MEESNNDPEEMMALNKVTGLVHEYSGHGRAIPISCGCPEFDEGVKNDTLVMIYRKHMEKGIWEPAECLKG